MSRKMKDSGIEWIGEIPEEWSINKVGFFYNIVLGKMVNNHNQKDTDYYLCAANIKWNGVDTSIQKRMYFSDEEKAVYLLSDGDVLIMEGGLAGTACIYNGEFAPCFIQNSVHRCRARTGSINKYLYYWMYVVVYSGYINSICNKATIMHYTKEKLNSTPIIVTTLSEQTAIAAYLDRQCTHIDNIIEKTKTSIEEYKKLKQAVITQAVTKGIRGNREMKDSGIDWIGEIPVEWEVRRIKNLFTLRDERNNLPLSEVNLISLYTDLGVVQHSDLEKTSGNKASNADGYKLVYENDIVVNIILCWMGAIGRSEYNGVTSPAYDVYVPSNNVECRYYHHYFRTLGFSGDCYKRGRGIMAMRWRTYSDQFRDISVLYPPLLEQKEVLSYLDQKCTEIDAIITKKQQFLTEMENYKKSLIFECVTGKREVFQKL